MGGMATTPTTNPDIRTIIVAYAAHARANRDAIERGDVYGLDIHTGRPLRTPRADRPAAR